MTDQDNALPRTVLLASPRSFCAGVERAIEMVERELDRRGAPVYVRKQIVHNTHVVNDLRERGAVFVEELAEVPNGSVVVFSAHGVAPAVHADARARGLTVVDATCPLVAKVHAEARRFATRGDTIVLIGHPGHEEVDGTLGEAPRAMVVVSTAAEVERLEVADAGKVSYLTQTTLGQDEVSEVVAALRARFPQLREPPSDDICYATTNRQNAVRAVLDEADVLLVIGSTNSSNTLRLVEMAQREGRDVHLIDGPADLDPAWLAHASTVAVTAGASAPPHLVDGVVAAIGELGPTTVTERSVIEETVRFTLPGREPTPPG
ncbi:MAG: 4-hydroxy-3-methylbut-2-enyl diphosphate reductase [Actinophytocola sp.]|uniref:4-hydroxy-3-methylbut-2-enyl diphosphate reductase n=1 Tax=Actinophytocola sp. TaxID=1872138 RepID=UPI003C7788DB